MDLTRYPNLTRILATVEITIEDFTTVAPELQNLKLSQHSGFQQWLADPSSDYAPAQVAVAYEDGKAIGWSGIGMGRGRRGMPRIGVFVQEDKRGQGTGRELLDQILAGWKLTNPDEQPEIEYDPTAWSKIPQIISSHGLKPIPMKLASEDLVSSLEVDFSFNDQLLAGLLPLCTAPHREGLAEAWVMKWCSKKRIPVYRDGDGNIWVNAKSRQDAANASLLLVAHLDHPGVMVESIDGLTAKGTWQGGGPTAIEEAAVHVFSNDGSEKISGRVTKSSYSRGRPKRVTIELEREPKNPKGKWGAVLDIPYQQFAHEIWGRSLDDLISVAACLEAIERAGQPGGVVALLSHQEEIGERGVVQLLKEKRLDPKQTRVLVIDTTTGTPLQLGSGMLIREGDDKTLYTAEMTAWILEKAIENAVPYALARSDGRTDACAFAEKDFQVGSLGLFLVNPHNESPLGIQPEIISTRDYGRLIWFLTQLIKN